MNLGMVGLGKMGGNMAERLRRAGHTVETYARTDPARTAGSLVELVGMLDHPRVVWLMIPAGDPTENAFQTLVPLLEDGDIIVDGGNSNFRDSQRRAEVAGAKSIHFLDAGVSGGVWGLEEGYCIMVGGPADGFALIEPFVRDLAQDGGYAHVGAAGAGHFVKMVHNGIEYGMMQSLGEGFEIMQRLRVRARSAAAGGALAARLGRSRLAARAAGACVRGGPGARRHPRLRGGLGRRPLDGAGGDRRACAGAGHHARALLPLRIPTGRVLCGQGQRGPAQSVRRARSAVGRQA